MPELEPELETAPAVDFAYLEGFAAGDMGVVLEVLTLYEGQAREWHAQLSGAEPDGWRDMAHTIKGASRGVGANRLGDLADRAEFGTPADLPPVRDELARVVEAIASYRAARG